MSHTLQYQVGSKTLFSVAGSTLSNLNFTNKCNVQPILLLNHAKSIQFKADLHLHKAFTTLE